MAEAKKEKGKREERIEWNDMKLRTKMEARRERERKKKCEKRLTRTRNQNGRVNSKHIFVGKSEHWVVVAVAVVVTMALND